MHTAALSLGANLGDRIATLRRALDRIGAIPGVRIVAISSMYATEPVGVKEQPEFINCAALLETTLSAEELLGHLRTIEIALGRRARTKWYEREIDIDILLYGSEVIDADNLSIPHPEMDSRRFVLAPLAEIAAEMIDPTTGESIAKMLARCTDTAAVAVIERGEDG